MTVYVYDRERGIMIEKISRAPMNPEPGPIATPMVMGDTPGYHSPIDGAWIEGRRARRYDLEKNNCVDANEISTPKRRLKNERFARKYGLEHLLEGK